MMKERIAERVAHGTWDDEWVVHPLPTINEPQKAMSWLTPDTHLNEDRSADLFLRASLARVDIVFMKTRRLFNALERPIGTSNGYNRVWHGYAPYNPAMVQKYLTFPGCAQLRIRRQEGQNDAGDAAGVRQASPGFRGPSVAGRAGAAAEESSEKGEQGYRGVSEDSG